MALSNVRTQKLGHLTFLYGTYDHTVGAAAITQTVPSANVLLVQVNPQSSSTTAAVDVRGDLYSVSTTGQISTVTIQNVAGVSSGTFLIVYATA